MFKYLLLIAIVTLVWWHWKKQSRRGNGIQRPELPEEKMVACAYCGVHAPESDCVADEGLHYCCEAHRKARAGGHSRQR